MKLLTLLFVVAHAAAGCSGSGTDDSESAGPIPPNPNPNEDVTPGEPQTIDTDAIVSAALSVINTELLQQAMDTAPSPDDAFTLVEPNDPTGVRIFACPISGTVSISQGSDGIREYDDCAIEGALFNGTFRFASSTGVFVVSFDQFSITRDDSELVIDNGDLFYSESADFDRSRQWRWTDAVFSHVAVDASVEATINEVNLEKTGVDDYRAEFDATMSVDGALVSIVTTTPLDSQNGDSYYTSGQFEIRNGDEFNIQIDADGGDPIAALITVTVDGSTDSQFRSWSESFHVECLSDGSPFRPAIDCGQ